MKAIHWFSVFLATGAATWAGLTVVKTFKPEAFETVCFTLPKIPGLF